MWCTWYLTVPNDEQVQCLAVDGRGILLLTGDESGTICARLLHGRHSDGGDRGKAYQSQSLGEEVASEGDVVAKVVGGAHEGGVLAMSHVEGSLREEADGSGESSTLFVSGGVGEEEIHAVLSSTSF